ncbi:RING/U-box superfamily protein [Actinidia rufa]|uniref:RING/U-box superfamily protein n=1 Tax=Actinidia rufa TaxID=165716 RepID=A0A7J0FLU1_9ERIC|nr:RING/U-box superfamily protein [Actinidia rufa]
MKRSEQAVEELRSPTKESVLASRTVLISPRTETERGDSSESSILARDESSSEDGLINVETSKQSKELVPIHQSNMDVANGGDTMRNKNKSQVSAEVINSSSSSPHEDWSFSHSCEVSVEISGSSSASVVSESLETSESQRDDTPGETTPPGLGFIVSGGEQDMRDGSVVHVDVVSISSSILSSSSNEVSNREARRNSRRLFWDAFSRRSSRRQNYSPTFVFSTDDADGLGSHDRWLLDVSGDFFHDGVGGDSGNAGSRIHSMNERLRYTRSEVLERINGGRGRGNPRTGICPSGLHPDGACSCESILMAEESGTRASISRIVMLAEALFEITWEAFEIGMGGACCVIWAVGGGCVYDDGVARGRESGSYSWVLMVMVDSGGLAFSAGRQGMGLDGSVLDEIHRQPGTLSLSVVSLPAPEAVVDSFPVRCHRKPDTTESADDDAQCYICLSEYEDSDKIRVLPCRHEFHMMCVDKWLKEIHGVCPLCRGDVREAFTEAPISNSETSV